MLYHMEGSVIQQNNAFFFLLEAQLGLSKLLSLLFIIYFIFQFTYSFLFRSTLFCSRFYFAFLLAPFLSAIIL